MGTRTAKQLGEMQASRSGGAAGARGNPPSPNALRALVISAALALLHPAMSAQTFDVSLPEDSLRAVSAGMPQVMAQAPAAQRNKRFPDEATVGIRALSLKGETRIAPLAWSPDVIPWRGEKVDKVDVIEDGQSVTRYWSELEPGARRNLLSNSYTTTQIIEIKSDGSLSIIPVTGSLKRKTYILVYNNFRYMDAPCSAADPGAGRLLVGVGLRVEATIKAKESGIGLGLPKLALSASSGKLEGALKSEIIGMASSSTLSEVAGGSATSADYDSLVKASSAYSVANALMESNDFFAVPHVVGFVDLRGAGSCQQAMEAALAKGPAGLPG
jgi:hypothetical protein